MRPGRQCAHNLNYWRFGDFLGIGAGAHGKLTLGADQDILRRWKVKHPTAYLATAGTLDSLGGDERIAPERRPFEFMLNASRLREGFAAQDFLDRTGLPMSSLERGLQQACERGLLEVGTQQIVPTERGFDFLSDLQALFLPD